jgi:hypothetical protein
MTQMPDHNQPHYAQPGYQPQYGQQLQAYGGHPAGEAIACRFCGATPAVMTTIREHHGMLVLMQNLSLKGPFCRVHGMAIVKRMTIRSLLLGWWGVLSLFVANPLTLIFNGVAWAKIRGLDAPAGQTAQEYAPPHEYAPPPPQAYTPPAPVYAPAPPQAYGPPQAYPGQSPPDYMQPPPGHPPPPPGYPPAGYPPAPGYPPPLGYGQPPPDHR